MRETYITTLDGEPVNNYEQVCEIWRKRFLEMDHEELIRRFSLESDGDALYIWYYHQRYRADRRTGMLSLEEDPERMLTFNTIMAIYHLFHYSKPGARVRGEFVPFRLVKRASPFAPAFKRTVLDVLSKTFEGRAEELRNACVSLGGRPIRQGDVGFVIDAFACMPVTMVFWDGDDEFSAQSNILFDADITDFIHEEDVCIIGSDLVRRLTEEASVEKVGSLLGV